MLTDVNALKIHISKLIQTYRKGFRSPGGMYTKSPHTLGLNHDAESLLLVKAGEKDLGSKLFYEIQIHGRAALPKFLGLHVVWDSPEISVWGDDLSS